MQTTPIAKKTLPIAKPRPNNLLDVDTDVDVEAEMARFEESERERIGMKTERAQWVDNMLDLEFKKKERDDVTLLISGLTAAQDFLCEGALRGLGYKVHYFGVSSNAGLQTGKEFGNRGQCNPTYFTVGSLVKHLIDLRDVDGISTEDIVKNYAFVTAGACGPCRFGMYVTEYRKALRDAGFDGFRVLLFQQTGGLDQATGDAGLEMNPDFFVGIIKAIVCGDVLNALAYRIRPYEVEAGATNKAMEEAKRILYAALLKKTNIFWALLKARQELTTVKVDKLRSKAKVSIIGEFWAMTTEGDGNYALQKFLESEGGENDIQLTTAWLLYNIWECARDTKERMDLRGTDAEAAGLGALDEFGVATRLASMRAAEFILRVGFQAFAQPVGLHGYHLPDMDAVADYAKDFYSNDLRGGEGHMEVGKLVMNVVQNKAHMTLSVKPFGCMPSSGVSDGVQTVITARNPGSIFCAVETSGDGATNFYSRVQMYMFKARLAAAEELRRTYEECGVTEAQVRTFLEQNPSYQSPFHHAPHKTPGSAANLVHEVAPMIGMSKSQMATYRAKNALGRAWGTAQALPKAAAKLTEIVRAPETRERLREDFGLLSDVLRGKAKERFQPLVKKLAGKAAFENNPEVAHLVEEPLAAE